jgi:DNA polymerase delta subunit 1
MNNKRSVAGIDNETPAKKNKKNKNVQEFEETLGGNYVRIRSTYERKKIVDLPDGVVQAFKRPDVPDDYYGKDISMQVIDVDYIVDVVKSDKFKNLENGSGGVPIVRMFGIDEIGHSVAVNVLEFFPYIYAKFKRPIIPGMLDSIEEAVNDLCKGSALAKSESKNHKRYCLGVERVMANNAREFSDEQEEFVKITLCQPAFVASIRDRLHVGIELRGIGLCRAETFESNVLFAYRYLYDSQIRPGGWITIPAGTFDLTRKIYRKTNSQVEIYAGWKNIEWKGSEGEWSKMAPMRKLAFDTEWAGRPGVFPDPEIDPVIQISGVLSQVGVAGEKKIIMTYKACTPINGAYTVCYKSEEHLIQSWAKFVRLVDPDIITGHNIEGFDFPWLLGRAGTLNLLEFAYQSRESTSPCSMKKSMRKGMFDSDVQEFQCTGRIIMDMVKLIPKERSLRSYNLNTCAAQILGDQKEDMPHQMITPLWKQSKAGRARVASYCIKDSQLCIRLMDKLSMVYTYTEMARATGVTINTLIFAGQSAKVQSLLYRKANSLGYLIPFYKPESDVEDAEALYEGAVVIEPIRGFYESPVATLDFASLCKNISKSCLTYQILVL